MTDSKDMRLIKCMLEYFINSENNIGIKDLMVDGKRFLPDNYLFDEVYEFIEMFP